MSRLLVAALAVLLLGAATPPEYSIQAIRFGTLKSEPISNFVIGGPRGPTIDAAFVIWLIRGGGHNILFDSGFHHERWFKEEHIADYIRPDEAVKLAGVTPEDITDIVISHAHWDHLGGIDLFPKATVWIQKDEFRYYTGDAWQPGGHHDGIDPEDVRELVRLNTVGRLHWVDGDDVQLFAGIRAYTGSRHTFASEYLLVQGSPSFVLAADNVYLYRNLSEHKPSATFSEADLPANLKQQERMVALAGSPDRVIPGHDPLQFEKYATVGRVAKIK